MKKMKSVLIAGLLFVLPIASQASVWQDAKGVTELYQSCPNYVTEILGNGKAKLEVSNAQGIFVFEDAGNLGFQRKGTYTAEGLTLIGSFGNGRFTIYTGTGTLTLAGHNRVLMINGTGEYSLTGNYTYRGAASTEICQ